MARERHTIATLFSYNDLLWTLLVGFTVFAVILAATYQTQKQKADGQDVPAGSASIYAFWPDGMPTDVDIHVLDPTHTHVYYQRLQSKITNLLRDDLGQSGDIGDRNFENVYIRDLIPGEYLVNVHAFNGVFPADVDLELNFLGAAGGKSVKFVYKLTLLKKGDELTAFRFLVGQDGKMIPGSLNHLKKSFIMDGRK